MVKKGIQWQAKKKQFKYFLQIFINTLLIITDKWLPKVGVLNSLDGRGCGWAGGVGWAQVQLVDLASLTDSTG